MFALSRLRDGGCILADEVGLGKTIEAGLVIAQVLAEGAKRVLLVAPKPLLGQWRQELYGLFGIDAREGRPEPGGFDGDGVFVVGRETVGSERGFAALLASPAFQLCVVDEAHEMFANIYRRFDQFGVYQDDSPHARTADRLRRIVGGGTPVILLTATPIQNSLTEMWGLVQYVDPTNTLLGDLPTFRGLFCAGDDRVLIRGQEEELRERLAVVQQRTLRRQAQEFLRQPFVDRQARLFEYTMGADEKALYDDVTAYLLEPGIIAFQGSHRQLLLIGFHRRMASSSRALSASLDKVVTRLQSLLNRGPEPDASDAVNAMLDDLEDDERLAEDDVTHVTFSPEQIRAEIGRVEGFAARAKALREDSKARALLQAIDVVLERGKRGAGSGKLIVFTESIVTQDYLRDLIVESGLVTAEEVTIFRGKNDSRAALAALSRWREEVGRGMPAHSRPNADIAMRLALVHEFKTRSKVFISTEAGAKGLNLQFCDTLVNFDLPWNPQRIEQRIGRCHRYGQKHAVTVVNFIARDNEAQRLTFDILSQKLELFGTVLDASDQVLHRATGAAPETLSGAFGVEIETELRKIYDRSRTVDEVTADLRTLREKVGEDRRRFEEMQARTASAIDQRLDADVRRVFKRHQEQLSGALKELDRDLERLVTGYLDCLQIPYERIEEPGGSATVRVHESPALPDALRSGISVAIGAAVGQDSLHLRHPLTLAALDEARAATSGRMHLRATVPAGVDSTLSALRGKRGRIGVVKVRYDGFDAAERLLVVLVCEGEDEPVPPSVAEALLRGIMSGDDTVASVVADDVFADAIDHLLFVLETEVGTGEQLHFERSLEQLDRSVEDRILMHRRKRDALAAQLEAALSKRDTATGPDARSSAEKSAARLQEEIEGLEAEMDRLARRDDGDFRRWRERALNRRYAVPVVERVVDADVVIE